ncbi:MAG TPA: SDR family oxidoreductase [Candidatus Sulfotelmatobacter sp.]|nr:SDR family oxidoreductase [Candidatus Sulfotelmatobacter sp.]
MTSSDRPVILITGGAGGIGAAIARAAATEYRVAISYLSSAGPATRLADELAAAGTEALAVRADLRAEADIVALFGAVDARFGRLDCLVNNAAKTVRETVGELTQAGLEDILRSNLVGPMLCAREAARRMATGSGGRGGSIVNLSSQVASFGGDRLHGYAASKGALASFTIGLARELAPQGIRVNAVSPGVVDSGVPLTPERRAELEASLPMRRICRPEEVAAVVLWLASPAASYVSGAIVPVHAAR